jgi:hypothetical protein
MNDSEINLHDIITAAPVAVAAPTEVDCVVHNLQTGATYRLNDVGARIWELVEAGSTIADILLKLRAEYDLPDDVSTQHVESDVMSIITELHQYGLIVIQS